MVLTKLKPKTLIKLTTSTTSPSRRKVLQEAIVANLLADKKAVKRLSNQFQAPFKQTFKDLKFLHKELQRDIADVPVRPVGKPTLFTPERVSAIHRMVRNGSMPHVAAQATGVSREQYYAWMRD